MVSKAPRLLYVPNEEGDFRQLGFRRPLENLRSNGLLGEVSVFSLQLRIRGGGRPQHERNALIERVQSFRPDIILLQHLGATGLQNKHFRTMRELGTKAIIYHEADPYSRFKHPLPSAARAAGRASDVTFTVGTGVFAENFRRAGARDVRWSPHVFEPDRYPIRSIEAMPSRPFDIVMIANRNTPRFRGLPNWRDRIRFVEYMQDRFGPRFAIFGRGWDGPSAQGPIEFSSQDRAIRSGWVSANWDHYATEPKYFSNRLPISLSAGSVHATTYHAGYEDLFDQETRRFLLFGKSFQALADKIEHHLQTTTPEERIKAGQIAQDFAVRSYRQDDQLVQMLNWNAELIDPTLASSAWDLATDIPDQI